ncbi:MAG TPA: AMP-binding protein, partial [Burkholderiaceae bacterium]|nr:AMP-binding protein [Burkholderiaceae bacterium]
MQETTLPRLLVQHARQRPQDPALREKEYGIWQTWSWQRALEDVRHMALGLDALGFKAGENLAILGDNRPQLYLMFIAVQVLRGVPVPMYQDAITEEVGFVLRDANVRFAFAEDQEQMDKFLELRELSGDEGVPGLDNLFYNDPRG